MAYTCPYCGEAMNDKNRCTFCDSELSWVQKIYEKSNSYYTKGYYEAKERNLTTARTYLEKAIYFNKYNITARNLLGLVYYEMGKIGSALKEWIISASLDKSDNLAHEYINKIQNSPKLLVTYKDSIILYNKALIYLKQDNNDMAIIRLKKAVGLNSRLIEAKNLLALCYMNEKQFHKANEQIKNVLVVDKSNLKALIYFRELSKEDTDTVQPYDLEYIPKQSKSNYVKPSRMINRGHVLRSAIMYFIIGVFCMFVVQVALIGPNKTKTYESQIVKLKESQANLEDTLQKARKESESKITELQAQNQKLTKDKQDIELTSSKMAQKEKITEATNLKNSREWVKAAEVLYNVAPSLLEGESTSVYSTLKEEVYQRASVILCDEGYRHLNRNELVDAKSKLEQAILYEPSPFTLRKSLYYLGQTEKEQGNKEKAKHYFTTVIKQYAGTNEAYWSERELKNIE